MNDVDKQLLNKIIACIENEVRKGQTINDTIIKLKYTINKIERDLNKFMATKCCLCGKDIEGYGNNPYPLSKEGRCCDACNCEVIYARMKEIERKE